MQNNSQTIQNILNSPRFWRRAIIALICINVFLVIYLFFGFSTITTTKDSSTIYVNGNKFANVSHVTLRPGVYTIEISSKDTKPVQQKIVALPFVPKKIELQKVEPIDTFVSARNAPPDANKYTDIRGGFLNDGYWYVGSFRTQDGESFYYAAIQYVFGEWQIQKIIPSDTTEGDDVSMLPNNVAAAFTAAARSTELE